MELVPKDESSVVEITQIDGCEKESGEDGTREQGGTGEEEGV